MAFRVDAEALSDLGKLLDRLGDDAAAGSSYTKSNSALDCGAGLLNDISGNHDKVMQQVTSFFESVSLHLSTKTGDAVESAALYYRRTDIDSARKLDTTLPTVAVDRSTFQDYYRNPGQKSASSAAFADQVEPQANYKEIADYNKDEDFQFAPQMWDVSSPASIARDTVWGASWLAAKLGICDRAYDPYESMVKPFSGDWAGLRGCADVLSNDASALLDMATNTRWAARGLDGVWDGNASDACQAHLLRSAQNLLDAYKPLYQMSEVYKNTATGAFEIGKVIGSLLADIIDAAIVFTAEASLAAGTSETVVGGVAFGAAALYEGYKLIDMIMECLDLVGRADSLMSAFNATAGNFGLVDGNLVLPAMTSPPQLPA